MQPNYRRELLNKILFEMTKLSQKCVILISSSPKESFNRIWILDHEQVV